MKSYFGILLFWTVLISLVGHSSGVNASALQIKAIEAPFPGSVIYVPASGGPFPGVLVLHGSEGGSLPFAKMEAQLLAAHGYAAMAYCWYNCLKNPITGPYSSLENVDLNLTLEAFAWLKNSKFVGRKKTAIYGVSRGAEQTLILGWKMAEAAVDLPDALLVHAPSDITVGGVNWGALDQRCWICSNFDLLCFRGSTDMNQWDWGNIHWNPSCGPFPKNPETEIFNAWKWNGEAISPNQRIEIEKYPGPIFVTHGTKDEWWGPERSLKIKLTLEKAGRRPEVHFFDGEKHNFSSGAEAMRKELFLHFLEENLVQ